MDDLPEHWAMWVDKDGNGPAVGDAGVKVVCWCGDPDCTKYVWEDGA